MTGGPFYSQAKRTLLRMRTSYARMDCLHGSCLACRDRKLLAMKYIYEKSYIVFTCHVPREPSRFGARPQHMTPCHGLE